MANSNLPESPLAHLPPMQEPSCPLVDEAGMARQKREEAARGAIPVIALIAGLASALALFLWQLELIGQLTQRKPASVPSSELSEGDGPGPYRSAAIANPFPGSSGNHLYGLFPGDLRTLEVFLDDSMAKRAGGGKEAGAAPIDDLWVTVGVLGEPAHGAEFVWTLSKLDNEDLDTGPGELRLDVPQEGAVHLSIVCRRGSEHLVYTAFLLNDASDVLHLAPANTEARLVFDRPDHADTVECEFQVASSCESTAAGEALPEAHPVWINVQALLELPDFSAEFIGLPEDYRMGGIRWSPGPSERLRLADLANLPEFEWTPPMTIAK